MTFETKKEAEVFGTKVLKVLKGKGWKKRVWEDQRWYVDWRLGTISLNVHKKTHSNGGVPIFWCQSGRLINEDADDYTGGAILWTVSDEYADPNKAVKEHLKTVIGVVRKVRNSLVKTRSMIEGT
jgi:hypothetical protein